MGNKRKPPPSGPASAYCSTCGTSGPARQDNSGQRMAHYHPTNRDADGNRVWCAG